MNPEYLILRRLKQYPRQGMSLGDLGSAAGETGKAILETIARVTELDNSILNLNRGIGKAVGINEALAEKFKEIADKSLYLELRNKEINKQFGVSSVSAARLSSRFQVLAESIGSTGTQMQQYAINMRSIIPLVNQVTKSNNPYYKSLSRIQQVLTTNLGLTSEQAANFSLLAMQSGKSANEQLAQVGAISKQLDPTGDIGMFKQLIEGLAETTSDLQLQYGKIPGNLELAILKSKALGFNMADLKRTADNLLNIESSIGDELEYQLLSGRRLVGSKEAQADLQGKSLTNAYREAALQRNASKQADVLNTILEQEGETLETNMIARQQMSKLLGMDEAALARALQKKKLLENIGGEELFELTGEELAKAAKSMGATDKAIAELVENEDTRTTDQKIEQVLKQMVETGIKAQLVNQVDNVSGTSKSAIGIAKGFTGARYKSNQMQSMGAAQLALDLNDKLTESSLKSVTLDAESVTLSTKSTSINATSTGDVVSMPGGGGRVLTGPFGAYSLDNRDMVMAGDPAKMIGSGGGGGDMSQLANVFIQVGNAIVAAVNSQTQQRRADNLFSPGINGATWS